MKEIVTFRINTKTKGKVKLFRAERQRSFLGIKFFTPFTVYKSSGDIYYDGSWSDSKHGEIVDVNHYCDLKDCTKLWV